MKDGNKRYSIFIMNNGVVVFESFSKSLKLAKEFGNHYALSGYSYSIKQNF